MPSTLSREQHGASTAPLSPTQHHHLQHRTTTTTAGTAPPPLPPTLSALKDAWSGMPHQQRAMALQPDPRAGTFSGQAGQGMHALAPAPEGLGRARGMPGKVVGGSEHEARARCDTAALRARLEHLAAVCDQASDYFQSPPRPCTGS